MAGPQPKRQPSNPFRYAPTPKKQSFYGPPDYECSTVKKDLLEMSASMKNLLPSGVVLIQGCLFALGVLD